MMNGNVRVQTGLRVDKFVFDGFKELCRRERMLVGEAVQRLMEVCLKVGSVALVLRGEGLVDAGQRKCVFWRSLDFLVTQSVYIRHPSDNSASFVCDVKYTYIALKGKLSYTSFGEFKMSDVVWKFVLQFFSQPLHMKLFSPIYMLLRLVLRGFLGRKRRDEIISKLNYHKNNVSAMAPLFLLSRFFRSPCFLRKSSYERRVREQLIKKGGEVFGDIGANIGFYTLVLSKNFRIIYAIEPNPRIFRFLLDNVKTVGVTNVRCIQKAVSDKNGILPLFQSRIRYPFLA